MEEWVIHLLKSLEDESEISEIEKNNLYPSGSKPGVLYELSKTDNVLKDGITSFRSILSVIGARTYKLTKFCDQLAKLHTNNEYTIKDSLSFAKKVLELNASFFVVAFYIKSLFTTIPLTETSNFCVQNLCKNQIHVASLTKYSLCEFVKITMFEKFFAFDGKFYEQCDDVAVASLLGPTLPNVLKCHFENIWLECLQTIRWLLFQTEDHVQKFKN